METKLCTTCKKILPITDFYVKGRTPKITYRTVCKSCFLSYQKSYLKSNPDARIAYAKKYYQTNKDKIRLREKTRYDEHRDEVLSVKRAWMDKNRERAKARRREFNKELRDKFLKMYGNQCVCCGETTKEFLTIEHKNGQVGIKRNKKETGKFAYRVAVKEYRPDLFEILCWNCNCSKGRYGYCPHERN